MLIGDSDATAAPMAEAANVSYTPRLPLPAGDSDVTVWMLLTGNHPGMSAPRGANDFGLKFNRRAT